MTNHDPHDHPVRTFCGSTCPITRYTRMSTAELRRLARNGDAGARYELAARG